MPPAGCQPPVAEEHQHRKAREREHARTPRHRAHGSSGAARAAPATRAARRSAIADRRSAACRRTRSATRTATGPDGWRWRGIAARPGTAPWRHRESSPRRTARATRARAMREKQRDRQQRSRDASPTPDSPRTSHFFRQSRRELAFMGIKSRQVRDVRTRESLHLQIELADQRRPLGLFLIDVGWRIPPASRSADRRPRRGCASSPRRCRPACAVRR